MKNLSLALSAITVANAVRDAFPKNADTILQTIRLYAFDGYWGFNYCGMFVGVECKDGYIHS
jgi:hypothetical protein